MTEECVLYSEGGAKVSARMPDDGGGEMRTALTLDEEGEEDCSDVDDGEDNVDSRVARSLLKLSLEDRESVYMDQHGVSTPVEETPELLASSMKQLTDEIQFLLARRDFFRRLPVKMLQKALELNWGYVHSRKHLLSFLRAERFNPKGAACRMARYFELKADLFGMKNLCQDINYDLLDETDRELMRLGFVQRLPFPDSAGRAIDVHFPMFVHRHPPKSFARIMLHLTATKDELIQKNGLVLVAFHFGTLDKSKFDREERDRAAYLSKQVPRAMPLRVVAFHNCLADGLHRIPLTIMSRLMSWDLRVKIKLHFGSYSEWMFKLMTYGIPVDILPLMPNLELKLKHQLEWITYRRALEEYDRTSEGSFEWIEVPSRNDVLLQKGKPFQRYLGNVRLHVIVADRLDAYYETTTKAGRHDILVEISEIVKSRGGRFLTQESGVWIPVPETDSNRKINQMLRNRKHKLSTMGEGKSTGAIFVKNDGDGRTKKQKCDRSLVDGS